MPYVPSTDRSMYVIKNKFELEDMTNNFKEEACRIVDGYSYSIKRDKIFSICTLSKKIKQIINIFYISTFKSNFISIEIFINYGYKFIFDLRKWIILLDNISHKIMEKGYKYYKSKLYILNKGLDLLNLSTKKK